MFVLNTCSFVYDALSPKPLGDPARRIIVEEEAAGQPLSKRISLYKTAMRVSKKRLDPGTVAPNFPAWRWKRGRYAYALSRPKSRIFRSPSPPPFTAIRLTGSIVVTALLEHAALITCDANLRECGLVKTVW